MLSGRERAVVVGSGSRTHTHRAPRSATVARRRGVGCRATPSDRLDQLRAELEQARRAMASLEEGLRLVTEEGLAQQPTLASEARGTFSLRSKEFEPKEWPRQRREVAGLVTAGASGSGLESERLALQTARAEALEDRVRSIQASAAVRERELLAIIRENERTIASMDAVIGDQEKFVAEIRRLEVAQALDDTVVYDSRVVDLEAELMESRAVVAEVSAEKERLERRLEAAAAGGEGVGGRARDPLLPAPATTADEAVVTDLRAKLEERDRAIARLEKEAEGAAVAQAAAASEVREDDLGVAIREDEINAYVAQIRALEVEMASMTRSEDVDSLAMEATEYKLRIAELEEELRAKGGASPVVEPEQAQAPVEVAAAKPAAGAFVRQPRGSYVLKRRVFVPKRLGSGAAAPKAAVKPRAGGFLLKKRSFEPKPWPREDAAAMLEESLNEKLNSHVARIRMLEIEMSQMATVQESDQLARDLNEARLTIHQLQMELELVRLSALNPSKHAMSVATGPPPPALEEAPVADVRIGNGDGSAPSAGFSRQPKGTFVLREKRFAPKTLGPRKVGFSRQEAGTFVLRSKKFVPKSLSRGSGFHRQERGSFRLRKKEFEKKPWGIQRERRSDGDAVFYSESNLK